MSTRNITKYVPPMEPYCIWSEGFYKEHCDSIKQLGELFEFEQGRIGSQVKGGTVDSSIRNTDIIWLPPRDDTFWIFDRMNEVVSRVNFDKYQLDLECFDAFQYSKYSPNGHYDWHVDTILEGNNGRFRKLSVVAALSDPEEYEGGELLLSLAGNQENPVVLKPKKGEIVVFYSHIPHKVAPVTSGERVTLVTWALGAKLK